MIRRSTFVLLVSLILVSPLGLAAQSADSRQMLETVSGESSAAGGCYTTGVSDEQGGHGFDLANLDRSVSPCDDFFQFADGGWVKSHPIPAAYPSWGTFNKLRDDNEDALQKILDKAAADKSAGPGWTWQKIGDFYASCMNESAIETAGITPLKPDLQIIADINDAKALQAAIASLQRQGVRPLFGFGSQQDFKNSTQEIAGAR